MGILRTDKVSGLETPTPVTGSVSFDGNGDWISVAESEDFNFGTGDFTVEFWIYWDGFNTGGTRGVQLTSAVTNGIWIGQVNTTDYVLRSYGNANHLTVSLPPLNEWHHIAVTRKDSTARFFVNGKLGASGSVTHNFVKHAITIGSDESSGHTNGYISNVRMLKGTALYTSEFTPSVHELEVIGDTVLLCCNNPDSAGAEATGKTITVNGDAAASTVSPGLTRDFTSGTEFRGVTTFDTQGYFVPPSGTTEQRGAGRAIFAGGYVAPTRSAFIESVNINSLGNTTKFGTLKGNHVPTSTSSATRQIVAGGYDGANPVDNIDFITIATSGDSVDFGTLGTARRDFAGLSNNTRSVFGGGTTTSSTNPTDNMEFVTSASLGSATSFGTLTASGRGNASCASPTRGIFFGGYQAYTTPVSTYTNVINYITIATTGNGTDFGDLAVDNNGQKGGIAAFSNSTRGVVGGGAIYGPDAPAYTPYNTIEYITMASTGNAQEFGDLTSVNNNLSGTTNSVRGIFNQGSSPTYLNTIQYVTIASTGNAQDFGDTINDSSTSNNAGSDSHGGLS